jgi:hypothetical protein
LNYDTDTHVVDSINKYFLNDEFKAKYDYDIYISTDMIDIEKTNAFFGKERIKNIYMSDNEYLLQKINYKNDTENNVAGRFTHQQYKKYIGGEMIKQSNTNYDIIVYTRFDNIYTDYIYKHIENVNKHNKLYGQHDLFAFGESEIMLYYLNLYKMYDSYNFNKNKKYDFQDNIISKDAMYNSSEDRWNSPEFKLFEHLFKFCVDNNVNIDSTIKKVILCAIYRGNEFYQFVDSEGNKYEVHGNNIHKYYM